jgi:Domain of unknown function (DUF4193)
MATEREQTQGQEDFAPEDEPEELEDLDEEELDEEVPPPIEEEEGAGASSLDELLAQRAAARRGSDDAEDDDDIMALTSERTEKLSEASTARVIPIKDRQEFVCNRCHLVKAKSQLADPQRGLCRDCV